MTATEALGRADYIAGIASRADVDRRTVVKCLRGESPLSTIWIAVQHAAEMMGITDMPRPAPRPPRKPPAPCAACAGKDAELTELRQRFVACETHLSGLLEVERAETDALRARVAELEAPRVPAAPLPSKPVAEPRDPALIGKIERRRGVQGGRPCIAGTRIPVDTCLSLARDGYDEARILALYPYLDIEDVRAALAHQESPRPAQRPRERCHVTLLMDGEDITPPREAAR